jgi:hypothetical protein
MFKDLLDATGRVKELLSRQASDEEFIRVFGMNREQLMNKFVSSYLSHVSNEAHIPYRNLHEASSLLRYSNMAVDSEIEDYDPDTHRAPKGVPYVEFDFWGGLNRKGGLNKKERKELEESGFAFAKKNKNQLNRTQLKFLKNVQSLTNRKFEVKFGEELPGNENQVQVEFPYLVRGKFEDNDAGNAFESVYRLVSVDGKEIHDANGLHFVDEKNRIAVGTSARYEEVQLTGSDDQWKGARLLDEIPQDQDAVREPVPIRDHPGFSLDGYRAATTGLEEKTNTPKPKPKDLGPLLKQFEKKYQLQTRLIEGEGVRFFRNGKPLKDQTRMHQFLSEFLTKKGGQQVGLAEFPGTAETQQSASAANAPEEKQSAPEKPAKKTSPFNATLPGGKINIHNGNEPSEELIKRIDKAIKDAEKNPNHQRMLERMKEKLEEMKCKK